MKNIIKNLILIILIIAISVFIGFCIFNRVRSEKYNKEAKNPIVTLNVEGYGEVKIELYPDYAPNTVKTFIKLVQNGYYNGKIFYGMDGNAVSAGMKLAKKEEYKDEDYDENKNLKEGAVPNVTMEPTEDVLRVSDLDKSVKPFVADDDEELKSLEASQRGDEKTDYKASIAGEFVANGFNQNTLRFEYGTIGLYRHDYNGQGENLSAESYNSGSSLFFIETEEESTLNGQYAAFGKVIDGMNIIEKMKELPKKEKSSDSTSTSAEDIEYFANDNYPKILEAKVETYDVDYGMPEFNEAFDYNAYLSNLIMQYYQNNQ